jgi:hypothetical protein
VKYRLYLDESGDHSNTHPSDIGKRYLGLVGVAFSQDDAYRDFANSLDAFRRDNFGEDPPVLHREDIVRRSGDFAILNERGAREKFDGGLLNILGNAKCWIVAVVVDKHQHRRAAYRILRHPYHYCLHAVMERYCGYLRLWNRTGDVMAESRGGTEDTALKQAYTDIYDGGTSYLQSDVCQRVLTSREIKIKPKHAGVHGLQLADILAHPLTRDVLYSYKRIENRGGRFCDSVADIAASKYNRQVYNGRIRGYGRVML